MSYVFVDSFREGPGWSCSKAVFKPVWHIAVPSVQWINSWRLAEELPETCRVSCKSKFGKLVHLVGFIIKKFIPSYSITRSWAQIFNLECCKTIATFGKKGLGWNSSWVTLQGSGLTFAWKWWGKEWYSQSEYSMPEAEIQIKVTYAHAFNNTLTIWCFSTVHHSIGLFLQPTLMHNSITTCMSHYYPRHGSGLDMPILRRSNCTNTASGILALLSGCTLHQLRADWSVDGILIQSISGWERTDR